MVKSLVSNTVTQKKKRPKTGKVSRYEAYCKSQGKQGMLWYLIPLMTLPAAIMPAGIIAMSYFPGYFVFIGISMLLFFTNIILTIAEQSIKTKITFYLLTVLFHVVVPLIAFILGLFS